MKKKLAAPIEEIAFAWLHVRGLFVFIDGGDELSLLLFDLRQKVVQFRGIFALQKLLDEEPGVVQPSGKEIGEGEIVAVVVGARIDLLCLFQVRNGLCELPGADIKLAKEIGRASCRERV